MEKAVFRIGNCVVEAQRGNIVEAGTEAIVNAANARLAGGGGVDGAIHRVAGPELYKETSRFGGCPTGSAVITGAGRFPPPTRFIIHAVGPIYDGRDPVHCAKLLAGAYRRSLELADENSIESVAFPSISTGAYGYPIVEAAGVAISTIVDYLKNHGDTLIRRLLLVMFSEEDFSVYRKVMRPLQSE